MPAKGKTENRPGQGLMSNRNTHQPRQNRSESPQSDDRDNKDTGKKPAPENATTAPATNAGRQPEKGRIPHGHSRPTNQPERKPSSPENPAPHTDHK